MAPPFLGKRLGTEFLEHCLTQRGKKKGEGREKVLSLWLEARKGKEHSTASRKGSSSLPILFAEPSQARGEKRGREVRPRRSQRGRKGWKEGKGR